MLSVFICEDDFGQREQLEKIVRNYIMIENFYMKLVMSTENPQDILDYLKENHRTIGLYFLDVDLKHEMSGIALALEIREQDSQGKIVFVTAHGELAFLTFFYKVEVMDYIVKGQPEETANRVRECIRVAQKRYLNDRNPDRKIYKLRIGDEVLAIPYEEIMFFETSTVPHKLILHKENGQLEFYGSIKGIVEELPEFYRCHKSYVINPKNVKRVDRTSREVEMVSGQICLVSVRAMKELLEIT